MTRTAVAALGSILLVFTAAQAQSDGPQNRAGAPKEANQAMVASAGDADLDYAQQMIAHHQSGIDMARNLLQHGKDGELRRSAEKMIVERQKELGELQLWLQKHRQ